MEQSSVGLFDTQPLFAEGVRSILTSTGQFHVPWSVTSVPIGIQLAKQQPVDLLLVDKAFGLNAITSVTCEVRECHPGCGVVVWGGAMAETEALKLLQCGVRGLLRRTTDAGTLLSCLRHVGSGLRWLEDCVFGDVAAAERAAHSDLTFREQQVLRLLQRGLKNREIAFELGIRPGTVKIHLKHIFEKTGARGRYSLVLDLMRRSEGGIEVEEAQGAAV